MAFSSYGDENIKEPEVNGIQGQKTSAKPQGMSSRCQHKAEVGFSGEGPWSGDPTGRPAVLEQQICVPCPSVHSPCWGWGGSKRKAHSLYIPCLSKTLLNGFLPETQGSLSSTPLGPPPHPPRPTKPPPHQLPAASLTYVKEKCFWMGLFSC